ncbi:kynureninase [Halopolyspora algeriensis]|uniref:Kynureninase n=1 Tax=Halopolyspora algeriensis TaxID=1500506 RepID=A0A368VPQ7_9ACTN|nr:aminotransferase class V-fold PLP-dependent enzyme [Halopolyspora algeriensis]RCW43719.1 kynureninase [Halopolyspora algeriensis]TQM47498.1 kynureninase [Halopolyspora algeriensis]
MSGSSSLAQARALDAEDELADYRGRFLPSGDEELTAYLDGNSLGRPPRATLDRITEFVRQEWGSRLIRGWSEGWLDLPERVGDRLGEVAVGAAAGQVVIGDSTTVCLYKLIRAAASARPERREIVTDDGNFPTDRYVVEGIAEELGMVVRWLETDPLTGVTARQVSDALGPETAVVTLSHIDYRSAAIVDMGEITRVTHAAGALIVWDLCHSVGCLPVELDELGADFAVGCTYKYLNAGPGAPAFMYARSDHHGLRQPVQGWLGRHDPFEMGPGYEPAAGIRRFVSGTPPILGLLGVSEGVELVAEAGIDRIRSKAVALTELAVTLTDEWLTPHGLRLASPRDPALRGAHITVTRPDAARLVDRIIAAGVLVDHRSPDGIRLGLSPLTTGFEELWRAMDTIRQLAAEPL